MTYPIVDITEAPSHRHRSHRPSGDPADRRRRTAVRPTAAAIANAIFDATGVRLRQAPFTPERLKAGMA